MGPPPRLARALGERVRRLGVNLDATHFPMTFFKNLLPPTSFALATALAAFCLRAPQPSLTPVATRSYGADALWHLLGSHTLPYKYLIFNTLEGH